MTGRSLADRVRDGDPRAIARAISLVEDESAASAALVAQLFPQTGRAYLVGVTGPPGAGKSTLVDRLAAEYRRAGRTVGILAVDPTSPYSGGAVLGDFGTGPNTSGRSLSRKGSSRASSSGLGRPSAWKSLLGK